MKLREIAELVGGELIGDGDIMITSVADLSKAQPGQLARVCHKNAADVTCSKK